MRRTCLTAGIAILAVAGIWQAGMGQPPAARPVPLDPAGMRERGAYLVNAAILCGDCHTPRDASGAPDRTRHLQGTILPIRPKMETPNWADQSPDITSMGLAGKLTEEQMMKFLMTGIDPAGKKARAPMPAFRLNAADAQAVIAYLKSVPGPNPGGVPVPKKSPE